MFKLLKSPVCPIGIDVGDNRIKLAQLQNHNKTVQLIGCRSQERPAQVKPGSSQWQRWVIDTLRQLTSTDIFKGKEVIASIPASDVFIDHLKMPKADKGKLEQAILAKIKQRLPYEPEQAMVKYIPTDEDNILVAVTEREKINRHLAVYEHVNMKVKTLSIWPLAIIKTYVKFFGRRKTDLDAVVFIIDIEPESSNIVICRHTNLLFARSIPVGSSLFNDEEAVKRFILELTSCHRHFSSIYRKAKIERLLFLSSDTTSVAAQNTYAAIARQMNLPAQLGNCLAAVESPANNSLFDRRGCSFSWATAFGLSLSADN